jgi:hypothetical protein
MDPFQELRRRSEAFDEVFGHQGPDASWGAQAAMRAHWGFVAAPARQVGRVVVETRAIPKGKAKAVELAVRAFTGKGPRDPAAWWKKNKKHVALLLEAERWPVREGGDEVIEVGPLTVHDTVHLTGRDRERTIDVVEKAVAALEDGPFSAVLYGPVYIVGQLRRARTLAWYYQADDTVYVRPHPKSGDREAFNLIHELGHRYWNKSMSKEDRQAWVARHNALLRASVDVPPVVVGDKIPVRSGEDVIVEIKYLPRLRDLQAIMGGGGRIPVSSIIRVRDHNARVKLFPTNYAMTDVEEHFAEAFAMYVMGTLPEDHEQFFRTWMAKSVAVARNPDDGFRAWKAKAEADQAAARGSFLDAFEASPAVLVTEGQHQEVWITTPELDPKEGKLRVTYLGKDGPRGHFAGRDMDDLVKELASVRATYTPVDEAFVVEWTSTPAYQEGVLRVAFVQADNQLRWVAGQRGGAARDWANEVRDRAYLASSVEEATRILERAAADLQAGRAPNRRASQVAVR